MNHLVLFSTAAFSHYPLTVEAHLDATAIVRSRDLCLTDLFDTTVTVPLDQ